jgi:type II restriction enzyme
MNNKHVNQASDLITTTDSRRSGFLEYALRRNKESIPFIDKAKALKAKLENHSKKPKDILKLTEIRDSLLDASGVSVKARAYLLEEDKIKLIKDFISEVLEPCAEKYIDELIYRYLLTAGDALGGKM